MTEHTRGEFIFYESPEGKVRVEVHHEDETFWLSQRQSASSFSPSHPSRRCRFPTFAQSRIPLSIARAPTCWTPSMPCNGGKTGCEKS